jgi:hypothetical protein
MQNFCISRLGGTKVKTLLNKCAVVILTVTLAISAYAGQIQFPGVVSGGGDGTKSTSNSSTTGITTTDTTTTVILAATSLIS